MNKPTQSHSTRNNEAYQEKLLERENWHKLVVKVLKCKDGHSSEKLTPQEWDAYCQKITETNLSYGKEKVLANLKETWELINNNDGFVVI